MKNLEKQFINPYEQDEPGEASPEEIAQHVTTHENAMTRANEHARQTGDNDLAWKTQSELGKIQDEIATKKFFFDYDQILKDLNEVIKKKSGAESLGKKINEINGVIGELNNLGLLPGDPDKIKGAMSEAEKIKQEIPFTMYQLKCLKDSLSDILSCKNKFMKMPVDEREELLEKIANLESKESVESVKVKEMWQNSAEKEKNCGDYESAAVAYEKIGNTEKAREMWQKEAKYLEDNAKDYKNAQTFCKAADIYEKLGNTEKAAEMWQGATEDQENLCHASIAYDKLGNNEKLKEIWLDFLKREGSIRSSYFDYELVVDLEKFGYIKEFQDEWKRIAEYNEKDFNESSQKLGLKGYYANCAATAYEKMGNTERARELWLTSAESYEKEKEYYSAARAYEKISNAEKAREMWQKTAEKDNRGEQPATIAKWYEQAGNAEKAREIWANLALSCEKEGRYKEAAQAYEGLIRLDATTKIKEILDFVKQK